MQTCIPVRYDAGQRLRDFMGDRSRQFSHGCHPRNPGQFGLRGPERILSALPLAHLLPQFFIGSRQLPGPLQPRDVPNRC